MFYAVAIGKIAGIYNTWDECKQQVNGYPNSKYKKFNNIKEAKLFISTTIENTTTIVDDTATIVDDTTTVVNDDEDTIIFTDGSCCMVNGQMRAGIGYYLPRYDRLVAKPLMPPYTNNRAELTAVIEAVGEWPEKSRLNIVTDSRYVELIFGRTGLNYAKNNYLDSQNNPVKNADLVKLAVELLAKYRLTFTHVDAHTGRNDFFSRGNAIADKLAQNGAHMV